MDRLSQEQRSRNMRAVKAKGSQIENLLAKNLYSRGYRYRRNDNRVFGKPDLTFKNKKIAIFCDSEFWHGKDWEKKKEDIKSNQDFWHKKIESNILRDQEVTYELTKIGWTVIRFWGEDIKKKMSNCISIIEKEFNNIKS
jgi:DNA mismatch endonuclease Vsr